MWKVFVTTNFNIKMHQNRIIMFCKFTVYKMAEWKPIIPHFTVSKIKWCGKFIFRWKATNEPIVLASKLRTEKKIGFRIWMWVFVNHNPFILSTSSYFSPNRCSLSLSIVSLKWIDKKIQQFDALWEKAKGVFFFQLICSKNPTLTQSPTNKSEKVEEI